MRHVPKRPAVRNLCMAQEVFDRWAPTYDTEWRQEFARKFADCVDVEPSDKILDLCCGTGLVTRELALRLGHVGTPNDGGQVTGVDISNEMIYLAKCRLQDVCDRVVLLRNNALELDRTAKCRQILEYGSFDTIVCNDAFTLLTDGDDTLQHWKQFLKRPQVPRKFCRDTAGFGIRNYAAFKRENRHRAIWNKKSLADLHEKPDTGGIVVIEIPHERARRAELAMEQTAKRMELRYLSNRSWMHTYKTFASMLRSNGFCVRAVIEIHPVRGRGPEYRKYHKPEHVDFLFAQIVQTPAVQVMIKDWAASERTKLLVTLKSVFCEEFMRSTVDDPEWCVLEKDSSYVFVAELMY